MKIAKGVIEREGRDSNCVCICIHGGGGGEMGRRSSSNYLRDIVGLLGERECLVLVPLRFSIIWRLSSV